MDKIAHISRSRQSGFTLLEVLIALLILSIGLLGLAALQTVGMRSNQMAVMRTQVSHLGYDITDRMRANRIGTGMVTVTITDPDTGEETETETYDSAEDFYTFSVDATLVEPTNNCDNSTTACSPLEMAILDLYQWRTAVAKLPGGVSAITYDTVDNIRTIQVYWNESRDPTAKRGQCPPQDASKFRCYQLVFQS